MIKKVVLISFIKKGLIMAEKRKSVIRKKIGRKIQTKQYESLEVYVDIEETIEWTTMKERIEKTNGINKLVIADYKNTLLTVLKELKLSQNKANVESNSTEASNELIDKVTEEADGLFEK